jgi:hypothetical protein
MYVSDDCYFLSRAYNVLFTLLNSTVGVTKAAPEKNTYILYNFILFTADNNLKLLFFTGCNPCTNPTAAGSAPLLL